MKALYYRYLFENVENGMIQAGSIYNEENDCSVNYVYLSGNPTNSNINGGVSSKDNSRCTIAKYDDSDGDYALCSTDSPDAGGAVDIGGTGYGREDITGTMDIGAGNVTGKTIRIFLPHPASLPCIKEYGGGKCLFIIWKLSALFPGRSAECQKRKLFRTGRCRGFRNDKDYGTGIHSGGQGRMHH